MSQDETKRQVLLAGDHIARLLQLRNGGIDLDTDKTAAWTSFDQGGTDPGNVAEFLAFDIPFDVEPAVGLTFPPAVDHG